jgi:hypothetical protein
MERSSEDGAGRRDYVYDAFARSIATGRTRFVFISCAEGSVLLYLAKEPRPPGAADAVQTPIDLTNCIFGFLKSYRLISPTSLYFGEAKA